MKALRLLLAGGIVVLALGFALGRAWPWRRLPSPPLAPRPVPSLLERADTLRPGESLGTLLSRHGVGALDLERLVALLPLDPRWLRPGLVFSIRHRWDGDLPVDVTVRTGPDERIRLVRGALDWSSERLPVTWRTDSLRLEGTIGSNLYDALDSGPAAVALSREQRLRLAWDLADLYAWQVDFSSDIQPGDHFVALVERARSDLGEERLGKILAGELIVGGHSFTAFSFDAPGGDGRYYDERAESLHRPCLRAPVQFRRISSRFVRSRGHPILGVRRRHQGTDYAAAPGTPVLAAGAGVVVQASWAGGYGRLVELRHPHGISTRYAHLGALATGVRTGTAVAQGQVIGLVGSGGRSNAPHLHYEFRINGVARNPARVDLGQGEPVARALMEVFRAQRERLWSKLRSGPLATGPVAGTE